MEFDEYYDAVCAILAAKGYQMCPDKDTVKEDFEQEVSVENSAEAFAEDWGDPGDEELD